MGYRHHLSRDFGHPFTREAGWDMLEVQADSESELSAYIAAAAKKFWKVWIRDDTGARRAALYKPASAGAEWDDAPGSTPVARLVEGANMRAVEFHVDLVLASLGHHVRSASSVDDLCARMLQVIQTYGASGKATADASKGLVGAVPLLNECLQALRQVPSDVDWKGHASSRLDALQLATLAELSALDAVSAPRESPPVRQRLSRRRP